MKCKSNNAHWAYATIIHIGRHGTAGGGHFSRGKRGKSASWRAGVGGNAHLRIWHYRKLEEEMKEGKVQAILQTCIGGGWACVYVCTALGPWVGCWVRCDGESVNNNSAEM